MEAKEPSLTSNDLLHSQLLSICSDLTNEQGRFAVAFVNSAHEQADQFINQIVENQLQSVVELPYAEMSGATAMVDTFARAFRHVGNVLDARHLGGFETHALG